jgi:hypothetical protein
MMAQKANALLKKYNITEFPVPVHIIEQIIIEKKYKIEILKHLRDTAATIGNAVLVGSVSGAAYRECLVHESCHIYNHAGNQLQKNKWQVAKDEGQAQAFAAYFLMPLGIFEAAMRENECSYYLSEEFGVTVELVEFRKHLLKSLLESGEYSLLASAIFF